MSALSSELRNAAWLKELDHRLFAVGVPCGSFVGPNGAAAPAGMHIRYGGQFLPVTRAGFAAWWQLLRPRTPMEICDWIEQERLGPGADTVNALHDEGVVVTWTADPLTDIAVIASHRLMPVGIGMGADPDDPEKCTVAFGLVGGTVSIDPVAYTVWAACDGKTPIGEACRRAAAALGFQVDEVWEHFHAALPDLCGGGMALLDR
jgi:hypothetical protein